MKNVMNVISNLQFIEWRASFFFKIFITKKSWPTINQFTNID